MLPWQPGINIANRSIVVGIGWVVLILFSSLENRRMPTSAGTCYCFTCVYIPDAVTPIIQFPAAGTREEIRSQL